MPRMNAFLLGTTVGTLRGVMTILVLVPMATMFFVVDLSAAPSTVERLSGDDYVVRDDNGNWGGTTAGITHQRGPDYQAKKVLDLTAVPEPLWEAAREVRLSVYFTVRDYSRVELPVPNGLDEAFEIVVNGKPHRVATDAGVPVYDEGQSGATGFRWHDFALPKDQFVRGANEIVFRLVAEGKGRTDDYLYLGIDNTVPTANSWVRFGKAGDWQQDKLTATGGKGEYMVRLYLLTGPREVQASWSPEDDRRDDPAGVIQYAGSHSGAMRMEWNANHFDRLAPVSLVLETADDQSVAFHWLDEQGETVLPPIVGKGSRWKTTLSANRTSNPRGIQLDKSARLTRLTIQGSKSHHPAAQQIDMAPKIEPPAGQLIQREPSCRIEGDIVVLANENLRCRFERIDGKLRLVSLYNEITASEMVRRSDDCAILLVEVDGKRYAGARDFVCQSIAPATERQGFTAVLFCEETGLEGKLSVWIDDALRMGLMMTNRSTSEVEFKTAFPHLSGLAVSDDPADDYYFFPWGGGIIADAPALIRRGYGDHEALYQMMVLFSPDRGGGLAVWCSDEDGRHKILALRKHVPGRQEIYGDVNHTPTTKEFQWTNSLEQVPGIGLTYEYLRRTRGPAGSFAVKDVALKAHAGDWRKPMREYADWCHRVWKFRPYPSKLKSVHNMLAAGWGRSPLYRDGQYRTDFVRPGCDVIELMSWWEWSPLGPFATPLDQLVERIGEAAANRWQSYILPDPVTGKMMFSNNPGDYDGYNERWGGLPALRKAIETYHGMGALVTLYTDPFRADYNTEFGRKWGEIWGVVGANGRHQTHYEAWNPCLDVAEYRTWVAKAMARVMRDTGADGIRLDEYGHRGAACFSTLHKHTYAERGTTEWQRAVAESAKLIREAMDEVRPESVLTTEHPGYDCLMQYIDGCITYDLTVQASVLRPLECNLQRFYFPECKAYELDHRGADRKHRKRFWNAVASFGSYYPAHYDRILRENQDLFASRECEPLIATLADHVYANRFRQGEKTIYALYNATGHSFAGPVLSIDLADGEHLFDLLRGAEADCRPTADGFILHAFLGQDDVACFVRLPKRLTVERAGETVQVSVAGVQDGWQLSLCGADGHPLATEPAGTGVVSFQLSQLPRNAVPVYAKLFADAELIDATALPATVLGSTCPGTLSDGSRLLPLDLDALQDGQLFARRLGSLGNKLHGEFLACVDSLELLDNGPVFAAGFLEDIEVLGHDFILELDIEDSFPGGVVI